MAPLTSTPFLYHWLPELAEELKVTVPPVQKVVAPPAVITGVAGITFTVTAVPADAGEVQPVVVTTTV